MNQPELGLKIAELRKSKGITQEELALNCNINVRTVQRIETGIVIPRSFTLKVIFSYLDYKIEEKPANSKYRFRISEYFNHLINGNFENIPLQKLAGSFIKYAWIAGIIYFLLGFTLSGMDYLRSANSLFFCWRIFYIALKLLSIVASFYYLGGFVVIGSKLRIMFWLFHQLLPDSL